MNVVTRARYRAILTQDARGRNRALAVRQQCFRAGDPLRSDADPHDMGAQHLLIEDAATGHVAACCRVLVLADGSGVLGSYSAQHYDLAALARFSGALMEVGRFCIHPGCRDPDVLRFAWAALTRLVDCHGVGMMFGCSSFAGISARVHHAAFADLAGDHLGPRAWLPARKAAETVDLTDCGTGTDAGRAAMPPLLRGYLAMGGWVSDHAVIDRDLGTLHVFTALEVAAIPAGRARALRALAAVIDFAEPVGD